MSLFSGILQTVLGGVEIAGGILAVYIGAVQIGAILIASGAGMVISGAGTLLSKGPVNGYATTERNPVAPWRVIYGRQRVGGTIVYSNSWGANNNMLDMVVVLAAHPCQSIDSVWFDTKRLQIDTNAVPTSAAAGFSITTPVSGSGTSFSPLQQTVNISSISRDANGIVTVILPQDIPYLTAGDELQIHGVSTDLTLNGVITVSQIISRVSGVLTFNYLSGGTAVSISSQGQATTKWLDLGRNVYVEYLLGNQTLGETFTGMTAGTPWQGTGKLVTPASPLAAGGTATPNPWTSHCSLVGKTAVFIRLQYDQTKFSQGLPQMSFLLHGKSDVYDPRSTSYGYTENAALCIADFLNQGDPTDGRNRVPWGFGAAYGTEIPTTELGAAADVCDTAISLVIGGTEPQWTCNGNFQLSEKRGDILENLLTSCAGRLAYYNGQYFIQPASWSTPLTPAYDLIANATGPFQWKTSASIRNLYNGVKGTFISPDDKWMSTDFPPYFQGATRGYSGSMTYAGDINLEYDAGDRRWLDIQLPFTISAGQAQRTAKVELLRRRWQGGGTRGTGSFVCNMTAYEFTPLDVITVDNSFLGWSNKQLEVAAVRLKTDKATVQNGAEAFALSTELDVIEIDEAAYEWSIDEELSPQGYQQAIIPLNTVVETSPYPYSPGYAAPYSGDSYLLPASFGIQPQYGFASDSFTANLDLIGIPTPNKLSEVASPQITCVANSTGGTLLPGPYYGSYVVGLSAWDSSDATNHAVTKYLDIGYVFITGSTGSITVNILWGSGNVGGDLYIGQWTPLGYVWHWNQLVSSGASSATITTFDTTQPGGPDPIFDHYEVVWMQELHGGPWANICESVTSTTFKIGFPVGSTITADYYAGYTISLLAKADSTLQVPILNIPILHNSTVDVDSNVTFTVGPNALSDTLDLTASVPIGPGGASAQLLSDGDLLCLRMNPTFTATTFTDAAMASPFFPSGFTTDEEQGLVACVLSGPDAGDVQQIDSVSGGTAFTLVNQWKVTPNTGDLVVICDPTKNKLDTAPISVKNLRNPLVIASPDILNLEQSVWLFQVRACDVNGNFGDDSLTPFRDVYLFGGGVTRTLESGTYTQNPNDGRIYFDATAGDIIYNLVEDASVYGQPLLLIKIDTSSNTVVINALSGDTFSDGTTTQTLANAGDYIWLRF